MKIRFVAIFTLIFLAAFTIKSQNDTIIKKTHSPRKATIYAIILPGLGQIYNKKYWKLPIVYGALGASGYYIYANNKLHQQYKTAFKYRTDNNPNTVDNYVGIYTDDNLSVLSNHYLRNMELSVIAGIAIYALSILDATVDAHLFNFQVNDNLSLKFEPTIINTIYHKKNINGLKLTLNF